MEVLEQLDLACCCIHQLQNVEWLECHVLSLNHAPSKLGSTLGSIVLQQHHAVHWNVTSTVDTNTLAARTPRPG